MFYLSEAYFKQFESLKDFLHFMTHFPLEFIKSNLLPCILEGFTYGDMMWATHNPSYIILHSYELVYNLVSYHVSVFHCITNAQCNLFGSTSFGYLYYIQIYRSIFSRSYKIVMELPFSIFVFR